MARILCIETSTKVCSVGLAEQGSIVSLKEDLSHRYSHAENVNVFVQEVLGDISFHTIDAVAVSAGPGSYTGLRIGVSTAKGICFGRNVPLISINPLRAMSTQVQAPPNSLRIPMIDARRMEVFCAGFDENDRAKFETRAEVIDENSFIDFQSAERILFFGDGAEKCRSVLDSKKFEFIEIYASAMGMAQLAEAKYSNKEFEDLAYFEPFYLKDFVAGKPKKQKGPR